MRRVLLAAAAVTFSAGAVAAPPGVVSASPQGELGDGVPERIQLVFSAPMVPLGTVAVRAAPPPWLTVEPAIAARWRWSGTAELIGEPLAPLPRATAYTLTVAAGATAADGASLARAHTFSFATPPPRVAVVPDVPGMESDFEQARRWGAADGWAWRQVHDARTDLLSLAVLLVFDQPVDEATVHEHVRLAVAGAAVVPRIAPDPAAPDRVFVVGPPGCWPEGASVELAVVPGVRSLEGPRRSGVAVRRRWRVPGDLAPTGFAGPAVVDGGALDPEGAELVFTSPVAWQGLADRVTFRQRGGTAWQRPRRQRGAWFWDFPSTALPLAPLALEGGRAYEVCIADGAVDAWGRVAPRRWCGELTTGHRPPRFYLVEGDGVVEWGGPHRIPLRTRNVTGLRMSRRRLTEEELVGNVVRREGDGSGELAGVPVRTLHTPDDQVSVVPIDLDPALDGRPGVVLSTVEAAGVVPGSAYDDLRWLQRPLTAVTQVTSLGLTVKSSGYEGILIWVTRLADATPVAGATVTVRDEENRELWVGSTDEDGLARTPDSVALPAAALVTARLGTDLAYARTRWYEGHRGWEFDLPVETDRRPPVEGEVWPDRGAVRPGEEVHVKAVVRRRDDDGLAVPDDGGLGFRFRDPSGAEAMTVPASLDRWGGAETAVEIPAAAPLGTWQVSFGPMAEGDSGAARWRVGGAFSVVEFRRPKIRVATTSDERLLVAGDALHGAVEGRFLAGGAMAGAEARWSVRTDRAAWRPPGRRWHAFEVVPAAFGADSERSPERTVAAGEGILGPDGRLTFAVERVPSYDGWPARLTVEGEVEDVDRQSAADRVSAVVLPGAVMVGVRRPDGFPDVGGGVTSAVVVLDPDGRPVADVEVTVELVRRHWESVRRREVSGRWVFESRPVTVPVATRTVTTADMPVEVRLSVAEGGHYALVGRARDGRGNRVLASTDFYVLGGGAAPWRMDQENRVDVVPEHEQYRPGETARLLVTSPWPDATALVTVERAGVLAARVERLAGNLATVEVPVVPGYAPNVFVGVVLLRGRVPTGPDPELIDPGRPAYRVGFAEISVPPQGHRLQVAVRPDRTEYRPGDDAEATVVVTDGDGAPRSAAVTLWAVDVGVLELTRYRTPDLVGAFFGRRGLGVVTAESRSRLVGRRSYGTKADAIGGGGGADVTGAELRRDFRPVAVWRGDLVTGADGRAVVRFALPDALTTYRVMAVAVGEGASFGSGETEITATVPVGLEPALPRFLRSGDRARAGVVVRNRTASERTVRVRVDVTGGAVAVGGPRERSAAVAGGGSTEVTFALEGRATGRARLRFDLDAGADSDALEADLAVVPAARPRADATFFAAAPEHEEVVQVPVDVSPEVGGLDITVASSLLVGAGPGAEWLSEYRFDCAEQVASRLLGLLAVRRVPELGAAFRTVPEGWLQRGVDRLLACRRPDGGFAFWPEGGASDVPLTAHVTWALQQAAAAGATVGPAVGESAAAYLSRALRRQGADDPRARRWTSRVLVALALARLGRPEPAYYQELFERRSGQPIWARALLAVAMEATAADDPRVPILLDEVSAAITVEARFARLQEATPEWGWRVWWSEPRASAASLLALGGRAAGSPVVRGLVRGLVDHLGRDRYRTTHDVAWELQALAAWQDAEGAAGGSVTARVDVGGRRVIDGPVAAEGRTVSQPMATLVRAGRSVTVETSTTAGSTVYGSLTLRFQPEQPPTEAVSRGLAVRRSFLDDLGRSVERAGLGDAITLVGELDCPVTCRFVAVELPLPAGVEPADPALATTARRLLAASDEPAGRIGFDHIEYRDDRVVLFATELPAGSYRQAIPCRATTAGSFVLAPAYAEAMYEPEVFGAGAGGRFVVEGASSWPEP